MAHVTLYKDEHFRGEPLTLNLDDYSVNARHSLKGTALHDKVSSVTWDLPSDVIVTLYEHDDGGGRSYQIGPGAGRDASTHNENFKDCATTWRWIRRAGELSVLPAFDWIATDGRVSSFGSAGVDLSGGHLQGLGLVNSRTLAISASSDSALLLFVEWDSLVGSGRGEIINQETVAHAPLDHAGGLQIADGVLAVGAEDNNERDRSRVKFYDVWEPRSVVELGHLDIDRPGLGQTGLRERWTAGAVGMAKTGTSYLVVVGSWNSDDLDFYRSTSSNLRDLDCRFSHIGSWHEYRANKSDWIDDNWEGYQSLNLIDGDNGRLFFVGGHCTRSGYGEDWLDLYELNLTRHPTRRVTKIGQRHLTCHDGASFRWAGGIVIHGPVLHAIAAERDLHSVTKINIFEGPGGLRGIQTWARFLANTSTLETHSRRSPCAWMDEITPEHRLFCDEKPDGFLWCDYCFPDRADG